jgi:phosphate ABC transporter phosphate-binding protein
MASFKILGCFVIIPFFLLNGSKLTYVFGQEEIYISGAGATFPLPLVDMWKQKFQLVDPNVIIDYQPIGSGGGTRQFIQKTVDFSLTDAPLSQEEERQLASEAVHIPVTVGSVVAAYNLPTLNANELKLTGPILADILMGKITKWNHPQIQSINSGLSLPAEEIVTVHRADSSGTTYVLSDYLSRVSSSWNQQFGTAKSIQWPAGLKAQGNEGVANMIENTTNSIGYIELAYALNAGMSYAPILNMEGNFIKSSLKTTTAAVQAASPVLPASGNSSWSNVSIVNSPGEESYPITTFSYLLLYQDLGNNISDEQEAQKLVNFISWAINEGQIFGPHIGYAPIPKEVGNLNHATLQLLSYRGVPISQ